MTTVGQILAAHRIRHNARRATYVTTCPECSHSRRKKKEPCLSVKIDGRGVLWNCHHCGWQGHQFYDAPSRQKAVSKAAVVIEPSGEDDRERKRQEAHRIWRETVPLRGTLGEKYFLEHRKIDIAGVDLDHALRWRAADRMVVGLMTDPVTNEPRGVHRIYLDRNDANRKRDGKNLRLMLGPAGVIRLWPDDAVEQGLVIGEGVETTLAAALGVIVQGTLLQPAWAAVTKGGIASFPVLPGISALTILVDHDDDGQTAAKQRAERWTAAGCEVIRLVPRTEKDFNDLIRGTT
jgi:putative DNA primase/helicase